MERNKMHVMVTGGAGYVGSTVIRHLLDFGYTVTAVDSLMFGGEALLNFLNHSDFDFVRLDLRDSSAVNTLLSASRYDAVVHLAALVGDPACSRDPQLARQTNWDASVNLFDSCVKFGVDRFIFASTCSNYGKMDAKDVLLTEASPLAPVSLYAELKVAFEKYILENKSKDSGVCATALRFATVYGVAPRMRFDLTVNEFVKEVALGRTLKIFGEQFWRPYCHVADFANAFDRVLQSPKDLVDREVFNVGDTNENYTKAMLWNLIKQTVPQAKVEFIEKSEDPRDYRVSFEKIKTVLDFKVTKNVLDGIIEVYDVVDSGIIRDPDNPIYYNIPHTYP